MYQPYNLIRRRKLTLLRMLLRAVEDQVQMDLIWLRPNEHRQEVRRVTVAEVDFTIPSNRVMCWDHTRKNYRTFKLADIKGAALTTQKARAEPVA